MNIKVAGSLLLIFGMAVLGYAYMGGKTPFTSQFVQTCDRAIKERLAVPASYERRGAEESRKTITFDEFFTDPLRAVSEPTRKSMARSARSPPVRNVALIDYQAQDSVGAIIRERATCIFNSLDGTDMPAHTYWVQIDGEYNVAWAARQPNAAIIARGLGK